MPRDSLTKEQRWVRMSVYLSNLSKTSIVFKDNNIPSTDLLCAKDKPCHCVWKDTEFLEGTGLKLSLMIS